MDGYDVLTATSTRSLVCHEPRTKMDLSQASQHRNEHAIKFICLACLRTAPLVIDSAAPPPRLRPQANIPVLTCLCRQTLEHHHFVFDHVFDHTAQTADVYRAGVAPALYPTLQASQANNKMSVPVLACLC